MGAATTAHARLRPGREPHPIHHQSASSPAHPGLREWSPRPRGGARAWHRGAGTLALFTLALALALAGGCSPQEVGALDAGAPDAGAPDAGVPVATLICVGGSVACGGLCRDT